MKKILITGGLGFIGVHLINHLVRTEDCVIDVVDNLANNSVNVEDLGFKKVRKIHTLPVSSFEFSDVYDQIYHLASPVGPAGVLKYAGKMGQIILNDTMKIAEYAYENSSSVIFISTSEVYGKDPGNEAQQEDIDKIVPAKITTRLEYGAAKMLTEICLHNFAKHHPFKYNIIRPFNIVGVGQSSKVGFVLPRFVYAALSGKPITVFGDGKQRRTFAHAKDFVDAIVRIMNSPITGEIFNVGNPANEHSIYEAAQVVKQMTQSPSVITLTNPKDIYGGDYEEEWNKIQNIDKIKSLLSWQPQYSLKDIVQEIIADYKNRIANNALRPNHEVEEEIRSFSKMSRYQE